MEQFFLEDNIDQIYSIYHEPQNSNESKIGIVLCSPLGEEYIRCHKLYISLANQLSNKGFHVLRFDYLGTGDSSGDCTSVSIDKCMENIDTVVNDFKETGNFSKIILFGIRLGANFSLQYAKQNNFCATVLWDPIMDGEKYWQSLCDNYSLWLKGSFTKEKKVDRNVVSLSGFSYSNVLQSQIKKIRLIKEDFFEIKDILLICDNQPFNLVDLKNIFYVNSKNKEFWVKRESELEKKLVPQFEINNILNWIENI